MCRLLGIYGKINIWQEVLREFQKLAEKGQVPPNASQGHIDGWGIATSKSDNSGMILLGKYEGSALDSNQYGKHMSVHETQPKIFLCHLRKASPEIRITVSNSHPFLCEGWAFIHNGTVKKANELARDLDMKMTSNDSDSEYLLHYLITQIRNKNHQTTDLERISKSFSDIKLEFSAVNSILSNGKEIFAIRHYKELGNYYTLFYYEIDSGVVISSEPIELPEFQKNRWREIPNRSILWINGDPPKLKIVTF